MAEKFCGLCLCCENDCKSKTYMEECQNYVEAISLNDINEMIKDQNTNIRRLCKENNLKYHIMTDMLKGKRVMKFKYRYFLEQILLEKEEFIPYLDTGVED